MSFRAKVLASAALATTGFLLAPSALAASHPVQVTGTKLKSALLPTSSFGSDHEIVDHADTGNRLVHGKARFHVPTMNCGKFENLAMASFGQTASAFNIVANQNPFAQYPNTDLLYWQSVYQFSSAKAATTFFDQERTKYAKCTDLNVTVPANSIPGSGLMEVTNQSMSRQKVGKYQSFEVGQVGSFSEAGGITVQLNTTITLKGTDVFAIESWSGTNDQVSGSLMLKFINRVSKLR